MDERLRPYMQRLLEMLGNPTVLIDTSYHLIAMTENPVTDDPVWNELTRLGEFTHETVDFFNRARFIQAVADAETVALLQHESLRYDRACVKLFDRDGVQLGSFVTVACLRSFTNGDFRAMESAALMLESALDSLQPKILVESVYREDCLAQLLSGDITDPVRFGESLSELRASLLPYLRVLVIDVSRYETTLSHLAYFRDLFSRLNPGSHYFVFRGAVAALISLETPYLRIRRDIGELRAFFRRHNITAGLSRHFTELSDIKVYYRQALTALDRGMAAGGGGVFLYWPHNGGHGLECDKKGG